MDHQEPIGRFWTAYCVLVSVLRCRLLDVLASGNVEQQGFALNFFFLSGGRQCAPYETLSRPWRLDAGVRRTDLRRHLRRLRHLDGVDFDALKFGDTVLALPLGRPEHRPALAGRVAVRGPRWAFPPRLCPVAHGRRAFFRRNDAAGHSNSRRVRAREWTRTRSGGELKSNALRCGRTRTRPRPG